MPRVAGRTGSRHFEEIYLDRLFPLEEYDLIIVLFSGGKDSTACYYKLLEMGMPKEKIELWHYDIDGGHPSRRMDWRCIQSYAKRIRELYPEEYAALKQDEIILGFTLDNKCDVDTFVGDVMSCVNHGDARAIHNLVIGEFTPDDVYVKGEWRYPAGEFHGAERGPC